MHLGQKQQVVFECVLQVSKLGTVATASYMKAATSETSAARTTAKSDKEVLGIAFFELLEPPPNLGKDVSYSLEAVAETTQRSLTAARRSAESRVLHLQVRGGSC